jgi:predicted DNA binding protein
VERESELRTRDRELQRRNRQLTRLNRVNDIIREIDRALVRAETREEIEHAVCERLTDDDRFAFAWIAGRDARSDALRPRAWAGTERGYLDAAGVTDPDGATEPAARTVAGGDPTVVQNVATDLRAAPWRSEALSRDYGSVASVPLAYDEFDYGALTVYATRPDAFDDTALAVLEELGETIASAVGSVERKNALLNDDMVELEYATRDAGCVFLRLAREADCSLELEGGVHRDADGVRAFVTVAGASPAAVVEAAADAVAVRDAREIATDADGGLVQLRLAESFVATSLAERGATLRSLRADAEEARLVVEVPSRLDVRAVDDLVSRTYADADLLAQRERRRDEGSARVRDRFLDALTDRQLEVARAAFHGGFFESPREQTGEELAAALGISPAAFHSHVRTIQRKLFVALFEESTAAG